MSILSLSAALFFALGVGHSSAQVPTNAPACVRNCASVKVSEGYCTSSISFASAYAQCLRDNCGPADVTAGTPFTTSICGAVGSNSTGSPVPVPGIVGANNATPPVVTGNTTGNSTDYATTVNNALRAAGLNTFATILSSPAGAGLVSQLQQGNHTVFAPSDSALASVPLNSTSPSDLNALLEYHVIPGTLDVSRLPSNARAIVRSSLKGLPYVDLPANDSQVMVLARQASNGAVDIVEPTRNITASNSTRVANLEISVIQNVLTVPGTIGTTMAGVPELSTLVGVVNRSAPQLLGQLDQTPGLTIFAPINAALGNVTQNTNYQAILLNHIVNGTVLYSTVIANTSSARSVGGAEIEFSTNGTGTFARSADKTVQVVQSDIITRNGVIHLVNGLFEPSNSTPTFPLVNTNNSTETVGITPVDGASASTASQAAAQSSAFRLLPSFGMITIFGVFGALGINQLMGL